MRKNLLLIIVIICSIFLFTYITTPKIDYNKIVNKSSIGYESYSLETNELLEETRETGKEKILTVQLVLNYENFGSISDNLKSYTDENYKEKRNEHRSKAKEYHEGNNTSILKTIKIENYQEVYISKYSPFIDITYDYDYFVNHKREILSELTNNEYVKEVRLIDSVVYNDYMEAAMRAMDAEDVYYSRSVTGDGVVVGLLETGIINRNDDYLEDVDITIRSTASNLLVSREHATQMARVIAGTYGIAPGVSLLSACIVGSLSEEMDWMVDNNVDIINMSCGQNDTEGYYSEESAYVDYIAYTYDIIMVAAAGNTYRLVANPGLGYNVITAAASVHGGEVIDYSAYYVIEGPIKPTISAPGYLISTDDNINDVEVNGTSGAAALCTGIIALLLEDYPSLLSDKARLISLIVTNAYESYTYDYEEDNGFDADTGGGLLNYQYIIDHYNTAFSYTNSSGQPNTIFKSRQIYLTAGQNLRAAFTNIAKADGTVSGTVFTDYDMYLKDPNGNVVVSVIESFTNVMMINYVAPTTGYYKIEIRQYSALRDTIDKTGFAYGVY